MVCDKGGQAYAFTSPRRGAAAALPRGPGAVPERRELSSVRLPGRRHVRALGAGRRGGQRRGPPGIFRRPGHRAGGAGLFRLPAGAALRGRRHPHLLRLADLRRDGPFQKGVVPAPPLRRHALGGAVGVSHWPGRQRPSHLPHRRGLHRAVHPALGLPDPAGSSRDGGERRRAGERRRRLPRTL